MRTFWGCSCPLSFTVFTKWSYSFDSCKVPILCFSQRVWRLPLKVFSCLSRPYNKHLTLKSNSKKSMRKRRNATCYMVNPSSCSLWERQIELVFLPSGSIVLPFSCHVNQCKKKKTTVDCMIKVIALATASVQTTPTRRVCLLPAFWPLQTHTYVSSSWRCFVFLFHKLHVELWNPCLPTWSECTLSLLS